MTQAFKLARAEAREKVDAMIVQLLAAAPTCISGDKKQVSIGSLLSPRQRCASCGTEFGLWERRATCFMCQKEHCAKCASLLSYAQIAGDPKLHLLLTLRRREIERERLKAQLPAGATVPPQPQQPQQPEEFLACTKCAIVVTRQEKARMYREVFAWGRRDNRLRIIYEEGVVWSRREMEKLFPRYARLVDAISREGSGKVFDPFSNPKTVGFSVDHSANDIDADFIHNYEAALTVQANLEKVTKLFERAVKEISLIRPPTEAERRVNEVIKSACVLFSQDLIAPFRVMKKRVIHLQMNKAAQLYLLMYQLVWEDKQHQKFWTQFGESLLNGLSMMKTELHDVVSKAGEDWDKYRTKVEDFLVDWERHNTALLRVSAADQTEGTVLRKNVMIVKKAMKQIDTSVGASKLPQTKRALTLLLSLLERTYDQYTR